ncbi:MAG: response regulator transcription factor [Candidatus Nanopelagicales bacterium]
MDAETGVMVAVASPLLARGLCAFIDESEGIRVVGRAGDADAVVACDSAHVCIWDAGLDDAALSGLSDIVARRPGLGIVLVAREGRPLDISLAFRAGATAIIDRDVDERGMREAITAAQQSRPVVLAGAMGALWDQVASTARSSLPPLTRRERQVLELMGRGLGNRAIAEELFISENTVKNHVRSLHEKLQVHSRTEAVVRAAQEGIVEIGPKGAV